MKKFFLLILEERQIDILEATTVVDTEENAITPVNAVQVAVVVPQIFEYTITKSKIALWLLLVDQGAFPHIEELEVATITDYDTIVPIIQTIFAHFYKIRH